MISNGKNLRVPKVILSSMAEETSERVQASPLESTGSSFLSCPFNVAPMSPLESHGAEERAPLFVCRVATLLCMSWFGKKPVFLLLEHVFRKELLQNEANDPKRAFKNAWHRRARIPCSFQNSVNLSFGGLPVSWFYSCWSAFSRSPFSFCSQNMVEIANSKRPPPTHLFAFWCFRCKFMVSWMREWTVHVKICLEMAKRDTACQLHLSGKTPNQQIHRSRKHLQESAPVSHEDL